MDVATTVSNAALQAYGYRSQATNATAEAGLDEATAAQAPLGADIGAVGSLASSAGSLASRWQQFQTTDVFTNDTAPLT